VMLKRAFKESLCQIEDQLVRHNLQLSKDSKLQRTTLGEKMKHLLKINLILILTIILTACG